MEYIKIILQIFEQINETINNPLVIIVLMPAAEIYAQKKRNKYKKENSPLLPTADGESTKKKN